MKTALQLQGISLSAVKRLLFVNPTLAIKDVFSGLASECELESSWRYMRTQKYQTVRQLLERWDFDGAIEILKNWQGYLAFLIEQKILDRDKVEKSNQFSQLIFLALDFSSACFNLDFQTARKIAKKGSNIASAHPEAIQKAFSRLKNFAQEYNHSKYRLLNLYTRNRISWQLDQNAIFLTFLATFCEEAVQGLILNWNKNFNKLSNRFEKRDFAKAIVTYRNKPEEIEAWNQLGLVLQQLDFWIEKRNELIHSAKGLSRQLMWEIYNNYIPQPDETPPCNPDQILHLMADITKNKLINLSNDAINQFVAGEDANYYVHSFVRDWVLRQLTQDSLQ